MVQGVTVSHCIFCLVSSLDLHQSREIFLVSGPGAQRKPYLCLFLRADLGLVRGDGNPDGQLDVHIVEDGDVEGEHLAALDRVGQPQLGEKVLGRREGKL